jgi:hypothetical protein
MEIDNKLLHILRHSIGLDNNGKGAPYRNHFATGPGCKDFDNCNQLVEMGYMQDLGVKEIWGDLHCFVVTPEGLQISQPKRGINK